MATRLLLGFNVVLAGLGFFLVHYVSGMTTSINTLTQRVTDLEVQNVQLLKQFEWMEKQIEKKESPPLAVRRNPGHSVASSGSSNVLTSATTQPDSDIVSKEWDDKVRARMKNSLDSFARSVQLDDDAKEYVANLLVQSLSQLEALTDGLQSKNLSQPEVAVELQKIQEEMDAKMSAVLSQEQIAIFHARFPIVPPESDISF